MIRYIFKCNTPVWTEEFPNPGNWVTPVDGYHCWLEADNPPSILDYPPVAAETVIVVGGWNTDGSIAYAVNLMEYETLRPLGNNQDGSATKPLLPPDWQGLSQAMLTATSFYPTTNEPFDVEIRHKTFTFAKDGVDGEGWRAEMHGSYTTRDPGVHAIAWYSDPECTQYIGTTGAFVQSTSEWQVDESGNPLTVWATNASLGHLEITKVDWHLALLEASVQRGYQTLGVDDVSIRYLFWENVQGAASYVDSGATWQGLVGSNTFWVSDTSPFQVESAIKIQDVECSVTQIFTPGTPGILVADDIGVLNTSPPPNGTIIYIGA